MIFQETSLKGAYCIRLEASHDERGYFARTFCKKEFNAHGLKETIVQCNLSYNAHEGVLRGMHYQLAPHAEAKLIRVTSGAIYDVIVDLRPESTTQLQWCSIELTAENNMMLYVPEGFAHGFQTLKPNSVVFYQMFEEFHPECARGLRWDDPVLNIVWPPTSKRIISKKDSEYPLLSARSAEPT